ncbi:MAG TPA: TMEM165/GDT1 family protein, partial [Dehalococcoidia bacterium]
MFVVLASFVVVALAELGDKSQLLVLAFAARYRPAAVLGGVALAAGAMHLLAVGLGGLAGLALPGGLLQALAGLSFIAYGLWTLRGNGAEDGHPAEATGRGVPTVALAFFLAELGDKTQLASVSLAAQHGRPAQVWLGAVAGTLAADTLAVLVGSVLHRRLPRRALRWASAALFLAFGAATLALAVR